MEMQGRIFEFELEYTDPVTAGQSIGIRLC